MITITAADVVGAENATALTMTKVTSDVDKETITVSGFDGNTDSFMVVEIPAAASGNVYQLSEVFGDYAGKTGESGKIDLTKGKTNFIRVNGRNVKTAEGTAVFKLNGESPIIDLSDQNIYVGFVNMKNAIAH